MAKRRPTKKKKKSGMPAWVWTGGSAAILTVIVVVLVLNKLNPGSADRTTSASSEANLAKQALPDDLPTLVEIEAGEGSIEDLFQTVASAQNILRSGGFEEEKKIESQKIIAVLKSVAKGEMTKDLLDKRIAAKRFGSPELKKDLQALTKAVSTYVGDQIEDGGFAAAREAAFAQTLLGKQIFEKNTRLKSRENGLAIMQSGLGNLQRIETAAFQDGALTQDELTARHEAIKLWMDAKKEVSDNWQAKLKSIETNAPKASPPLPNIADLKQVALHDEDPTFRIFAARRLGYAVYERGDPGSQKLIAETIALLKASDDKAVAAAAEDGASIKDADEWHELRN